MKKEPKKTQVHRRAASFMWAGMMRHQFTDAEWSLLRQHGFLSPHDEAVRGGSR